MDYKDMSGKRKGMLTVLPEKKLVNHRWYWKCQCDCGSEPIWVAGQYLREGLKGWTINDCGCVRRNRNAAKRARNEKERLEAEALRAEKWAKENRYYSRTKNGKRAFIRTVDRKVFEENVRKYINGQIRMSDAAKNCGISEPGFRKRMSQYFFPEECGEIPKEFFGLDDDARENKMDFKTLIQPRLNRDDTNGALPASMLPSVEDFK